MLAADTKNVCLQAPTSENHHIMCGPEYGLENAGKIAITRRALYRGEAAGRDFRNHLRSHMTHLNFKLCLADPDVQMRPAIKSNGNDFYEHALLCADDALVVSENAESILRNEIGKCFELKEQSIGHPKAHLGGSVRKVSLEGRVEAWAFSSSQHVRAAIKNVEDCLRQMGQKLPSRAETPIQCDYRPELDVSPELGARDAACFQTLIGVLRWMVELGRVGTRLETPMMSSHAVLSREGHLEQAHHMFSCLKKCHNTELAFDLSEPEIEGSMFERRDWASSEFRHVLEEGRELPPSMPQLRRVGFVTRFIVHANVLLHSGSRRNRIVPNQVCLDLSL